MITMVSTIANGGEYIKPRVVKQIIDGKTGEKRDVNVQKGMRVISKETSLNMLSMMESVVSEGTGKNAKVEGYRIGGKTGTSEDGVNTGKYVTSFIGVAPIENPQVAVLITLYNPTGEGGHQGGGVAAPIGGQLFSEILPYLEISKSNIEENDNIEIEVPNIEGLSIKEAKKILKEMNLNLVISNEEIKNNNEAVINLQVPKSKIKVKVNSNIYIQ